MKLALTVLEQTHAMLELRDAKLELVEVLARDEAELARDRVQGTDRLLADALARAAHARRELRDQLLDRSADLVSGRGHVASCAGAAGASRGARPEMPPPAPHRGAPVSARRRAPLPTPRARPCPDPRLRRDGRDARARSRRHRRRRLRRRPRHRRAPCAVRTPARAPSTWSAAEPR